MREFETIAKQIGSLVEKKNKTYGSAFLRSADILKVLYPSGIKPNQYIDVLGTVRVLDKLFRIATSKKAFQESPWKDIAGYGILGANNDRKTDKKRVDSKNSKRRKKKQ